jgi:hypothetical protein
VGADTHHRGHLDTCYQWLDPFDGPTGFLDSLRRAHFVKRRHTLPYFLRSAEVVFRYKLGLGTPSTYGRNCTRRRVKFDPLPLPVRGD